MQTPEVLLKTNEGISEVFLNGALIFSGGRVPAKYQAAKIATENNLRFWVNEKENGRRVKVKAAFNIPCSIEKSANGNTLG